MLDCVGDFMIPRVNCEFPQVSTLLYSTRDREPNCVSQLVEAGLVEFANIDIDSAFCSQSCLEEIRQRRKSIL